MAATQLCQRRNRIRAARANFWLTFSADDFAHAFLPKGERVHLHKPSHNCVEASTRKVSFLVFLLLVLLLLVILLVVLLDIIVHWRGVWAAPTQRRNICAVLAVGRSGCCFFRRRNIAFSAPSFLFELTQLTHFLN